MHGQPAGTPVTLRGVPIPPAREFKQMGAGMHLDTEHGKGLVLQAHFQWG